VKRAAYLLPVVAVTLVLAACGGGGGGSESAEPAEWVDQVCTTVVSWRDELQQSASDFTTEIAGISSLEEAKGKLGDFLNGVIDRTDVMLDEIVAVGAPAVDRGDEIQAHLREGLEGVRGVFSTAADQVGELPIDDPLAFAQAAQTLAGSIESGIAEIGKTFDSLGAQYDIPELDEASDRSEACQDLQSSGG
jgi:hypothetical protein